MMILRDFSDLHRIKLGSMNDVFTINYLDLVDFFWDQCGLVYRIHMDPMGCNSALFGLVI